MVNDYGVNYFMPIIGSYQVDRSDEHQYSDFSNDPGLQSVDDYNTGHQDVSSYDDYGNENSHLGQNYNFEQTIPVSRHIEVTKPIAVPVYKDIGKFDNK